MLIISNSISVKKRRGRLWVNATQGTACELEEVLALLVEQNHINISLNTAFGLFNLNTSDEVRGFHTALKLRAQMEAAEQAQAQRKLELKQHLLGDQI